MRVPIDYFDEFFRNRIPRSGFTLETPQAINPAGNPPGKSVVPPTIQDQTSGLLHTIELLGKKRPED